MPRKSETIKLPEKYDRRVKLTEDKKAEFVKSMKPDSTVLTDLLKNMVYLRS